MKRKMLAAFLALAMMLSFASVSYAAGDPTLTAGDAKAAPGETVLIPVTLTNNPGITDLMFFGFRVLKDGAAADADCGVSAVTVIADVAAYNEANGTAFEADNALFAEADFREFSYLAGTADGSYWDTQYEDGVLFYIVVEVAEDAQADEYEIELYATAGASNVIYDFNGPTGESGIAATFVNGTLTVTSDEGGNNPTPDDPTPDDPTPDDPTPDPEVEFTVSLTPDKESVAMGQAVDVALAVSGADFNAYDITVTYDADLFAYGDDTTGVISLTGYDLDLTDGSTVETLRFTAKEGLTEPKTGQFSVSSAKVAVKGEAMDPTDAHDAGTASASVEITEDYLVKFLDREGNQLDEDIIVTIGGTVPASAIPAAPEVAHYNFLGWKAGEDTLSAADVAAAKVLSAVTYTAAYEAETYKVTLPAGQFDENTPATATYDQPYTGTVADANADYTYTVTAQLADGTSKDYEVSEDGSFTIPAGDITGDVTLTVSWVSAQVYTEYVAGYSLIVVYGSSEAGYVYDGNAMYRTAHYDVKDGGGYAYGYLIEAPETALTEADVLAALVEASAAAVNATAASDVNASGAVDIADVQAVADCYNVEKSPADYMAVYLRADVSADHLVNSTDANMVLQSYKTAAE